MNYNEHNQTNEFLDSLASDSFIFLILQPTKINSHPNTLLNNIISNVIDPDIIPGNLTATISDHLPQFSIVPNVFGKNYTITNPYDIANTFNNYFAYIAETTKKNQNIHINIFQIIF